MIEVFKTSGGAFFSDGLVKLSVIKYYCRIFSYKRLISKPFICSQYLRIVLKKFLKNKNKTLTNQIWRLLLTAVSIKTCGNQMICFPDNLKWRKKSVT